MLDDFDIRAIVQSKLNFIDSVIGDGFQVGLHVISGISGVGKTALLLQIANSSEFPTFYLNDEMNQRDLQKRLITLSTDVEISKITKLPKDEIQRLIETTRSSNTHLELIDGQSGHVSLNLLRNKVEEVVANQNPDTILLIIDSFNKWIDTAKPNSDQTKDELVAELITNLRDLIQELNLTVLVSAQHTNKQANDYVNNALLAAADTYIELSWERNGRVDAEGFRQTRAFYKKNRNGVEKISKIGRFKGELQRFSD